MAAVEESKELQNELQEFIGFEQYQDFQPTDVTKTWTDEDLLSRNARLAEMSCVSGQRSLADIFEYVVVDGRNATKFKGPDAAAYLALHEESKRESAKFWQSDLGKKIQAQCAACEAAAGVNRIS
jgi:hypothetical protein